MISDCVTMYWLGRQSLCRQRKWEEQMVCLMWLDLEGEVDEIEMCVGTFVVHGEVDS